jgi:Zn-dependent peptidase ImmA (M78 family)
VIQNTVRGDDVGNIYRAAENAARKFQTRNPYELLDAIGAKTHYCYDYEPEGLKGFSTILNRVMFAVINGHLNEHDRRIVAGHEAAHLILHKTEILLSPAQALKDFNLYDNSGRLEYQANSFLANFLVSDEAVLDVLSNEDSDYFANAKELCIPPPLLAFKLHSMMRRDYKVRTPVDLQSGFLGGHQNMW